MSQTALLAVICLASCGLAWALTSIARTYALKHELIDTVTGRSSHDIPTPRGGGISIVAVSLLGLLVAFFWLGLPNIYLIGLFGGGLVIAIVGWIDDHNHVSPAIRLAGHLAGSFWAVYWIGALNLDFLPFWQDWMRIFHFAISGLIVAWMINLYNFMDGIDGLAGGIAVSVGTAGALVMIAVNGNFAVIAITLITASASLGFLLWNWPPAKIFMGDASSGFLGFFLAALAMVADQVSPGLGIALLILPGVFIADASMTLLRRLFRGDKVQEAHRSHAYQRLTRRFGGRHLPVTLGAIAITWLFLFPIALGIAINIIEPFWAICMAYAPLSMLALILGAGVSDENRPKMAESMANSVKKP